MYPGLDEYKEVQAGRMVQSAMTVQVTRMIHATPEMLTI